MTVSTRIAATMVGLLLTGFASEAQAVTVTYDFTTVSSAYSLTKNFTAPLGLNLTVSANTVSTDGSTVTPVPAGSYVGVGQWQNNGLGIRNSPNDNSHTIDGYGLNDLLVLTFASSVKIVSASFNYAGKIANSYDDFAFFADLDNNGSVAGNMIFLSEDIVGAPYSGSYNFITGTVPGNYISKVFGIGAIFDICTRSYNNVCKTTKFDSFKLASVTVETIPGGNIPEVPLPAGVILLFSGLAGLGVFGRFKSKASQAAA